MKKFAILSALALIAFTGCMTHRVSTVTGSAQTGWITNTVTVVNTNNLMLDCIGIQVATSEAVTLALGAHPDPAVIQALKNAQIALDGIIHGANQQTKDQVIAMLKAQNNPALTSQIDKLITALSGYEQSLIVKYGPSVGGQIAFELTEAVYSGLTVGLVGH